MDEDLRYLIKETKTLAEENNKILHSLQRRARWSFFGKLFYWSIIFGVAIGAFYYLKPYAEGLVNAYHSLKDTESKIQQNVQNSLNFFKKESSSK